MWENRCYGTHSTLSYFWVNIIQSKKNSLSN